MERFDHYFRSKMKDPAFRQRYKQECHVCANTVQIFAKIEHDGTSLTQLSAATGADEKKLKALRDADYCDPEMVIRLCRYLELPIPEQCPRRSSK